jgi:dTDP-4-amino-4,6-dideoxygalactose transaminase
MPMIPHSRPTLGKEESAAALAVLHSGQIAQGERVTAFEKALAARVGVGDAAAVSSGTAALQLALLALGAGEGDEIVIPSFVCPALLHAVRAIRAVPVLADIDRETFNLDIRDLRRRLTRKTKAVIVPHLFGLPADIAYRRPVFKPLHRYLGLTGYPETEAAFAESVSLPIYPSLRDKEANTILRHLRSILD